MPPFLVRPGRLRVASLVVADDSADVTVGIGEPAGFGMDALRASSHPFGEVGRAEARHRFTPPSADPGC